MANGIADIKPDVPTLVRIANFSSVEVILPKNMRLRYAVPASSGQKALAIHFEGSETKVITQGPEKTHGATPAPVESLDE